MRIIATETRTCQFNGCDAPFESKTNSPRMFCDEHTSGIGRKGRGLDKTGRQAAERERMKDPEVLARSLEKLKEENTSLRSALKLARKEDLSAESIKEKCYEVAGTTPDPPVWLMETVKGGTPGVPTTVWSDWHFGEVVRPEEVGYVNEFNSEIAEERVKKLVQSVIDLCYQHMVLPQYPGLVVNVAGDIITGDIHQELADTNDKYIFQSLLQVQDLIIAALTTLANTFGRVFVPWVVGNHGRDTIKPRMKGRAFTSYEWHLGCQVERHFRDDPRVHVLVSNEADAHYRVYDHRYLVTHGDSLGVKGGDGIIGSLGPIMRGRVKVGRAESQIHRDFDTLVMGHWHQYMSLPGVEVNGSLKGYDEYARLGLRAPYQRPTQALWFTHHKYGVTAKWPVYLEAKETPDGLPWVSWQEP